jgi:hypothetical protein
MPGFRSWWICQRCKKVYEVNDEYLARLVRLRLDRVILGMQLPETRSSSQLRSW